MSQTVKTQKPSQDTINSLFQEISNDLMENINGGLGVGANGVCHNQLVL